MIEQLYAKSFIFVTKHSGKPPQNPQELNVPPKCSISFKVDSEATWQTDILELSQVAQDKTDGSHYRQALRSPLSRPVTSGAGTAVLK